MTAEEDAWAVPEPNAGPGAAGKALVSEGEDASERTDTSADAAPQAAAFSGGAHFPAAFPRVREPDRTGWLVAALLLLVAGVVEAAILFAHTKGAEIRVPLNDSPAVDVDEGSRALVLITCGVLLLLRRTREVASGLVLGVAAIWVARYFYTLRPSYLTRGVDTLGAVLLVAAFVLLVAGAISVLTLTFVRRARAGARERSQSSPRRQRRPDRIAAVLLGFGGAALCAVSGPLAWEKFSIELTDMAITRTESCCSWSQVDGWNKTAVVTGGVMVIVLAMFAATIRAKMFAAGMLLGAALLPAIDVLRLVVIGLTPVQSFYGIRGSQHLAAMNRLAVSGDVGFWVGVAGVVLIAAAAVCRLLLGWRQDRFSIQAGYGG